MEVSVLDVVNEPVSPNELRKTIKSKTINVIRVLILKKILRCVPVMAI